MNLRAYLKSYWFWFYLIITLYTVYDFFDHIFREDGAYFNDQWAQWLLFTICCLGTLCLCIYFFNLLLKKLFKSETLISQSLAIVSAMLVHLYISGRIFDLLIFGHSTLMFNFKLPIFLVLLSLFYFIRIVMLILPKISAKKMR
jgi:hypothetical protein